MIPSYIKRRKKGEAPREKHLRVTLATTLKVFILKGSPSETITSF